ncbi:hypothetical protein PSTT_13964 [Puccinia striiformis]|uniref:Uncharacterized protein n=1 Tax=Puccinia striiformis TaxID=27350 RepID=A0A2S4UPB7_9BASI|nr:hypothetical protein PSTT_13964 [Puccinia striiformis]
MKSGRKPALLWKHPKPRLSQHKMNRTSQLSKLCHPPTKR